MARIQVSAHPGTQAANDGPWSKVGAQFGKNCFGLDQSQVRLYTAIARHTVLVMAVLAICAITAALLHDRTRHPGATTGQAPASRRPPTRNDPAGHPPRSPARSPPPTLPGRATPSTGRTGAAATKPAPAGTTSHTPHPRRRIRPQLGGLSVKLRHGRALEAKVYRGSPRMLDVVGRARGRLESWDKCSFPVNRLARGLLTCQAGVRCAS